MRLRGRKIFKVIQNNYDLTLGFLFFVSYRYYFTWLLWTDRGIPPISDNAYFYLSSAHDFANIQNFEQFRLIIFSAFLNFLSLFTLSDIEAAFKLNFYIGPILMFTALAFFLKKLEANRNVRLLLFIIISLFSGSGAYHGFYWVVPSFYQLALFFVIAGFLVSNKKVNPKILFAVTWLFIFIHPTSIFVSFIFYVYALVLFLIKKPTPSLLSNIKILVISMIVSFTMYFSFGLLFPSANSPQSFATTIGLIKSLIKGNANLISLPIIWQEYFAIFFFNPFSVVAYFLVFYFTASVKQVKLIALFLGALALVAVGAFIPYGARTLQFLWPLTFLTVGYGLVGLFYFLAKFSQKLSYIVAIPLLIFTAVVTLLNLVSVNTLNQTKDYTWDRSCPSKLTGNTIFNNLEALYAFNLHGLPRENQVLLLDNKNSYSLDSVEYIVSVKDTPKIVNRRTNVGQSLANKITRRQQSKNITFPINSWTQQLASTLSINEELEKKGITPEQEYDCGKFVVYRIKKQ